MHVPQQLRRPTGRGQLRAVDHPGSAHYPEGSGAAGRVPAVAGRTSGGQAASGSMSARANARSAAAFAVVAVRRGLPLESVDILPTIVPADLDPLDEDVQMVAGSCAKLAQRETKAWLDALPDPAAVG